MAKKQKIVDLRAENLSYEENGFIYKLNYLKTVNMTIEMSSYKNNSFVESKTIPFAHLSKSIKNKIKPN